MNIHTNVRRSLRLGCKKLLSVCDPFLHLFVSLWKQLKHAADSLLLLVQARL